MKHPIKQLIFRRNPEEGQSLVEYTLILVLVALAFGFALAATGPAISNVFSNTVYNLLGEAPEDVRAKESPVDFWLTVTWVAANPLPDRPLPTPTRVPPSLVPPADLTPRTPTTVPPTPTAAPTNTPVPTATPADAEFPYPYINSADDTQRGDFRLGGAPFLGYNDWYGRYFVGRGFNPGNLAFEGFNADIYGPAARRVIDFPNASFANWVNNQGGPRTSWPASSPNDNFSIKFTREIYLDTTQLLRFYVDADDGVRLWILAPGENADNCATGTGTPGVASGQTSTGHNRFFGDDSSFPTSCLLIDDWNDQGPGNTGAVFRTVPAGIYTLQVDYYENGGGAELRLDISSIINPDDTRVNTSGQPVAGGAPNCNWGTKSDLDSNSLMNMWEEYVGGDIPGLTRCYLELRGFIPVPGDASSPHLTFWDVWDMNHSSFSGWLEVAEYIPIDGSNYAINRPAMTWYRVPIRSGTSFNYNWTYNELPLDNLQALSPTGTPTTLNFVDKRFTFRFVMQSASTSGNTRRWYIDDMEVKNDLPTKSLVLSFAGDNSGPTKSFFQFNDGDLGPFSDRNHFITTGQWDLTANNAMTDPDTLGNPSSCCSWELNPGSNYTRFSEASNSSTNNLDQRHARIHYIQFAAPVSRSLSLIDHEGDDGAPMLSFMSGYRVGTYTSLEVQYRAVGDTVWRVIPGDNLLNPGRPAGVIYDGYNSGSASADERALRPVDIDLTEVKDTNGIPIDTFYIRFALITRQRTDAASGNPRPGWWIDDIRLHRKGIDRFLDYPFFDDAEDGIANWLPSGQWWRMVDTSYSGVHSFTDSPEGNYASNTDSSLRMIRAIDFRNNTPDNLAQFDRNPAGGNSQTTAAQNPVLSFWHLRRFSSGENFHVEWRTAAENESQWKRIWTYVDRMSTDTSLQNKTRYNDVWEYVEIDLRPIVATFTADVRSDDILFRFRLITDGSGNADGLYIDDIRVEDRQENVFRLWESSENPTVNGQQFGNGTAAIWASDADESDWTEKWRLGGEWERIDWEQHNGLGAFHESANGQSAAPYMLDDSVTTTAIRSFQVLEMTQIIDMRSTDRATRPTLYFWTRFRTARQDRLMVQISYELLPSDHPSQTLAQHMQSRCRNNPVTQCYEQLYGWSQWMPETIPPNPSPSWTDTSIFNIGEFQNSFGWTMYQVDLSAYAANFDVPQREGRRIRIRFVYDALENGGSTTNPKRDGWYIDNLRISPRIDQRLIADIGNDVFFDGASNLNNWITEGIWGLDPEVTSSGGATVATLGVWREYWWDCRNCINIDTSVAWNQRMAVGADVFLRSTDPVTHNVTLPGIGNPQPRVPIQRSVLDINYRMGTGTPRPGVTTFTNDFVGRWVLETPVIGASSGIPPGQYTFITVSDDGVRLKIDEIDGSGNIIDPRPPADEWNVIHNWTDHGEMTDMGRVTLQNGRRYRIVLEYYERGSSATIILSLGGSTFSFTDSPKQGAGVGFPDIPSLPYANTSLVLNGVLDLQGTTRPILEYYTLYELDSNSQAIVEVSNDGGFTWRRNGLSTNIDIVPNGCADNTGCDRYDNPVFSNAERIPGNSWLLRRHNLSNFEGQLIMIRFRLNRSGTNCLNRDGGCQPGGSNFNNNGWLVSWWIVDITVAKTS